MLKSLISHLLFRNLGKFTMLERIHHVKGIGLLHDADGKSHGFNKYTLIYAENGRGKSTLASVLRSCSTGDVTLISNRRTLGGNQEPDVKCQFKNGVQVLFTGGNWNRQMPNLAVFDTDFVEKNVYSGVQVRPDQRQGLLEFALGSQAINARNSLEQATQKARDAQGIVSSTEKELTGYRKSLSLEAFMALPLTENIDQQIETWQNRLAAARDKSTLQQKAIPKIVPLPEIDLDRFFSILAKTLHDIETDAEQKVISHIATHNGRGFEDWISQGHHQYENNEDCPYCGQSLDGNDLIRAYRTHFNAVYIDLKQEIVTLGKYIESNIADLVVERFAESVERNQAIKDSWNGYVEAPDFAFDKDAAFETLKQLQSILSSLLSVKQQSLLEHVGTEIDKVSADMLWHRLIDGMQVCNGSINISAESINRFKTEIATENVQTIQLQIERLEHTKVRHGLVVDALITRRNEAIAEKESQDQAKIATKASLDNLMTQVLQQYSTQINELLTNFGASFQITPMGFNYLGGSARSNYGLSLRGEEVNLSETGGTSFATALSEGDKRTLAFAFFIAKIKADPNIATSIVVVDDPMCSLDRNRRQHTRDILKDIGNRCSQLVILGHDLYFLRDLHDDLIPDDGTSLPKLIKLGRVQNGYTNFTELKIDRECESGYYRHYRLLTEFVDGVSNNTDLYSIAKAIRPMLEGYLHRRFPCRIKRSWMFGTILSEVGKAQSNDPLKHLESLVPELNSINRFAGKFHHDTNPAADTAPVTDEELRIFAERALKVVHKGMP